MRGTENVDPAVVRSFIYAAPGEPLFAEGADRHPQVRQPHRGPRSPLRVREAAVPSMPPARLPVARRRHRAAAAPRRGSRRSYSTLDGPGLRAYWANRNLFGGAERLRLRRPTSTTPTRDDIFRFDPVTGKKRDDMGLGATSAAVRASFLKPALYGTRPDLLVDGTVAREVTD